MTYDEFIGKYVQKYTVPVVYILSFNFEIIQNIVFRPAK